MCRVSIHVNAEWKQQDGDLATTIVQVELIQTEIYLPGRSFSLIPRSLHPRLGLHFPSLPINSSEFARVTQARKPLQDLFSVVLSFKAHVYT